LTGDPSVSELAVLGHNLRTPLTIINGYADLLRSEDLTPEARAQACRLIRDFVDAEESILTAAGVRRSA